MNRVWLLPPDVISSTQRLVLLNLASHGDDRGLNAYPSVERMARQTSFTPRAVQKALRHLADTGFITAVGRTSRGTIRYALVLERIPDPHAQRQPSQRPNRELASQSLSGGAAQDESGNGDAWSQVLGVIETKVDRYTFAKWFFHSALVRDRGVVIEVKAQSDLHAHWIIKHHSDVLHQAVNVVRPGAKVEFAQLGFAAGAARSANGPATGADTAAQVKPHR